MTDARPPRPAPNALRKTPRAKTAVTTIRETASKAADTASDTVRDLSRKAAKSAEANPVAVLGGGIALGVIAGAFVPRTEQEARLLRPVGKRITDTARGAVEAAKDTAKSELDMLGLTRNAARDQVGKLLGDVVKALTTAGAAALVAAKASPPTQSPAPAPAPKKPAAKKSKPKA